MLSEGIKVSERELPKKKAAKNPLQNSLSVREEKEKKKMCEHKIFTSHNKNEIEKNESNKRGLLLCAESQVWMAAL